MTPTIGAKDRIDQGGALCGISSPYTSGGGLIRTKEMHYRLERLCGPERKNKFSGKYQGRGWNALEE